MSGKLFFLGMELNTNPGPGGLPTVASILSSYLNGGGTISVDRTLFTTIGPGKSVTLNDFNFTKNNSYSNYPVGSTIQLGEVVGTRADGSNIYDENDKAAISYYERSGIISRDSYIWGNQAYRIVGNATVLPGGKLQVAGELRPFNGNFDFQLNREFVDIPRTAAYIATILAFTSNPFEINTGSVSLAFAGGPGRTISGVVDIPTVQPRGAMSSARFEGTWGLPELGSETNTLDVISERSAWLALPSTPSNAQPSLGHPTISAPELVSAAAAFIPLQTTTALNVAIQSPTSIIPIAATPFSVPSVATNGPRGGYSGLNVAEQFSGGGGSGGGYENNSSYYGSSNSKGASHGDSERHYVAVGAEGGGWQILYDDDPNIYYSSSLPDSPKSSSKNSKNSGSNSSGSSKPILLDIAGNGLNVDELSESSQFVDFDGDGFFRRTAWASDGTGVLVLDGDGDGKISRSSEFVFTDWDSSASGDLEAVRNVFDTNQNGKLDAGDSRWTEFKVAINGQLKSLSELGIVSIDLTSTGTGQTFSDGSAIAGTTTFTRVDGSTGAVGDAILANEQDGYKLDRTVTTDIDGSSSELIVGYTKDGRIAFRNLVTKSSDGSTVTTNFDDDGDGTYDRRQTKSSYTTEDGSYVEIVTNFNADNSIANSTKTETSADKKLVTMLLDQYGTGLVDQYQVFEKLGDGSTRTTTQQLSRNGSVLKNVVATAAADGLSKSTSTDVTGDGVADMIETETSTIENDGNRTRTVKELARDGAVLTSTTVSTTRNTTGTETTTMRDVDGDGLTDQRTQETTTVSSAGEVATESASYAADGTLLGKTTLRTTQDGKSTYLTRDIDGNGSIDIYSSDVTIVDAVGEKTRTETVTSGNGSLLSRRVVLTSADQKIITETFDANGDGAVDTNIVTSTGSDGATSKTESRFNADGSLISRSSTVTSADGSSSIVANDIDGDGVTDSKVSTARSVSSEGSATISSRVLSRDGSLVSQVTSTTSPDATNRTVVEDLNGDGSVDRQTSEVVVFNDDASRTKTVTIRSGDSTLLGRTTVDISADRLTTIAATDSDGDGVVDKHEAETTLVDGQTVLEEKLFTRSGTIYRSTRKTVSASGLSTTVETDINGDGTTDYLTTVDTVINDDGSRKETTVRKSANGATIQSSSLLTSGNGLTVVSEQDFNGDGIADTRSVQSTVYEQNGSVSKTVSSYQGTTFVAREKVVTSGNALSTVASRDFDGDGYFDQVLATVQAINADGSVLEEVSAKSGNGTLISKTAITVSADKMSSHLESDTDGDGIVDRRITTSRNANGVESQTTERLSPAGAVGSRHISEASANGLSTQWRTDFDGDGVVDASGSDVTTIASDGSRTQTVSKTRTAEGSLVKQTIFYSRDGLTKRVSWYDGSSLARTQSEVKVLNANGTATETISVTRADGSLASREIRSESVHGITSTISRDLNGDGIIDQELTRTLKADGAVERVFKDFAANGGTTGIKKTTDQMDGTHATVEYDFDGDGVFDRKFDQTTTIEADGKKIGTAQVYSRSGSGMLLSNRQTSYETANGLFLQKTFDLGADGSTDFSSTDETSLSGDGSRSRTISTHAGGVLASRRVTTTSANGLSVTTKWDPTGAGVFTQLSTDVITYNANGSVKREIRSTKSDGSLLSAATTTTSANGLSSETLEQRAGLSDRTTRTSTLTRADGSTIAEAARFGNTGQLLSKTTSVTSAEKDRNDITIDVDGDGVVDQSRRDALAWWGERTSTTTNFATNGAILQRIVSVTAPDGLSSTTTWDLNGDGVIDQKRIETKTLSADGSRLVKRLDTDAATGSTKSGSTDHTTADGRYRTISKDLNGDGTFDQIERVETLITGQTRSTVTNNTIARDTKYLPSGGIIWKNAVAHTVESESSFDGSETTTRYDYDGDGVFETVMISQRQIDGSVAAQILENGTTGSILSKGTLFTSADGQTTILNKDIDNDGDVDERNTSIVREDGSVILKKETLGANGAVSSSAVDKTNSVGTLVFRTSFDGLGRKTQETAIAFDGSSRTTSFDAASGSVTSVTNISSSGHVTSATLYDPLNSKDWTRVEQTYNAAGQKTIEKQFLDNGTSIVITFVAETGSKIKAEYLNASGVRTSLIDFDPRNTETWREVHRTFDAQGRTLTQINFYDNGTRAEYTFDVANTQVWSRYINEFDSVGRHYYAHQLNDDGSVYVTTIDTANSQSWSKIGQSFDVAGRLLSQVEFVDNGTRTEIIYDPTNIHSWNLYFNLIDSSGRHYYTQFQNDDGSFVFITFDVDNAHSWWRDERGRDSAGRETYVSVTQDNGTRNATFYDAIGNQGWSRIEQSFDSGGRFLREMQFNDNETTKETIIDAYGQYDWTSQETYRYRYGTFNYSRTNWDNGYYTIYQLADYSQMKWTTYDQNGRYIESYEPPMRDKNPVLIDINNDGHIDLRPINLGNLAEGSDVPLFDWDRDGVADVTAWAGPQDGFLAIDLSADGSAGPDGLISQAKELAFTLWPTEEQGSTDSDLEALRLVFDTNNDGLLSAEDARWSEFRVWQDINQNGVSDAGELSTLDQLGIKYINLIPTADGAQSFADGSAITGTSFLEQVDGQTRLVGDVRLAYQPSSVA
ncbi:adhesin [Agrobacterium tumefaciens]|nr:adhesin [Agrobacterium tumefaciens]